MPKNNFIVEVIASLKKNQSQKQIRQDLKNLGDFGLPVTGTLHRKKTKAQIKQDLASINGDISLTGKVNGRDVAVSLKEATAQAQRQADAKPVAIGVDISVEKEKLLNEIRTLTRQSGRMLQNPDMNAKYGALLDQANTAETNAELDTLHAQLSSFRSELKATGNTGQTVTGILKDGFSKIVQVFGGQGLLVHFAAQLRAAWTEAKILDQSMTALAQANAEITRDGFPDYLDRVTGKAQQLAVSVKDYMDTVTLFSKAGYGLADSEALSGMALQLEKVGSMSAETAAQSLLSGLQAYEEIGGYGMTQTAEKAQALNDKIALIGNTASISQEEAAQSIQAVGAVMSKANTSVDEFLALLAAGNRSVQDSDKMALAIGESALRMQSCTEKLQEMGAETDNVIESTSVLAEKIRSLTDVDGNGGIAILEADGETLRSVYDIYNDIAKVYGKMAEQDADTLLTLIAGNDNSDRISAVLQNMAEANTLLEMSLSSAGTASAEYQTYLDSAEAASERFGAAMTQAYSNILGGDTVTALTNAGAAVLDFANSWGILEGTITGFLTLGILKGVTNLTMAFQNSAMQISNYGEALKAVTDLNSNNQGTQRYIDALGKLKSSCVNLTDAQLKRVLANGNLNETQLIEILQLDSLKKKAQNARLAELGLLKTTQEQTTAQGAATVSTFSFSAALKGLGATIKAAIASNPIGLAIMAFSTIIGLVTTGIHAFKQKQEEALQEAKQTYQNLVSEIEKLNEDLKTTGERLGELDAIGYGNLSLVEQEEYDRLKETNAELERELRLKEALANVEAQKIGDNTRKNLEKQNFGSISYIYGAGRTNVDQIDSLNEYLDLADRQRTSLETAQQALEDYENAYSQTAEEMAKDKSWLKLNENVESAEKALSATENIIGEKYKNLETESEGLVDAFGNVVAGCEEIYNRIKSVKERMFAFFFPEPQSNGQTEEPDPKPEAPKENTQTLFAQLTNGQDALNKFKDTVKAASDAYGTLLSGDYSASELLDSIQTINQAVSDMDGSLNWEFLGRQAEPLEVLGDALEYVSHNYAESILSGAGIDKSSEFGQLLADMIEKAYETEAAFTNMHTHLDNLQSSYQTLTGILESYNETGTINLDNLQSLLTADENLISLLEVENGQLVLNQAAYENLVAVQLLEFKAKLGNAAAAEIEALAKSKAEEATNQNADTSNNAVEKLDAETAAFGRNTSAAIANAIAKAEEAGVSEEEIQGVLDKYTQIWDATINSFNGDFGSFMGGATKSATKAAGQSGAQAADAYLEAFEEELQNLKDLKDRGTLTEKEYLDRLRRLYEQYFKDKSGYLDEYQKYEHEYLQGMKSLYESVFSTITREYDKKIDAANDSKDAAIDALEEQKDAAIDALEAERDARLEALESQKDALQEQADAIDKQIAQKEKLIDGIQEEIDAIRDANQERENEINLQQKKYELERAQNQRTSLVYRDGSLQYQNDPAAIREKQEEVKNAETEMEIFQKEKQVKAIEKEIALLEERKDLIQEQQDAIDKQMDAISEHYDALIAQTEKQYDGMIKQTEQYWDTILKGFEEYKSRYEELADMEAEAKAMADLKQLCEEMGVTVEQVLGMSDEAFQAFRDNYTKTLAEIYAGNAGMTDSLSQLTGMKQAVEGVASAISGGAAPAASGAEGETPGTGNAAAGGSLTGALDELKQKSDSVLGSGAEDTDGENPAAGSGVIGQFGRLEQGVGKVTNAIGSNTGENTDAETDNADTASLTGSLSVLGTSAQNVLGEPEGDGVTGRFQTLGNTIGEADAHVSGIYEGLKDIDGEKAECTITVHIETTGGLPAGIAGATGTSLDTMNLNSARYGARFAHQEGLARVTGDWGIKRGGSTLVGELGQELVVFPDGRFKTVGDSGAEFVDIPDGSILFNHLQTQELLRNKRLTGRGTPLGGTPPLTGDTTNPHAVTLANQTVLTPVPPDDKAWETARKWEAYVKRTGASPDILTGTGLIRYREQMEAYTKHSNIVNAVTNNRNLQPNINVGGIHITCPGITSQEVAKQVGVALNNMFSGLHNYADQYARIR